MRGKRERSWGLGRTVKRVIVRVGLLASVLSLVFTGNASAVTMEVGQAHSDGRVCGNSLSFIQIFATPNYSLPDGIMRSWSTQAGPNAGTAALEVWRSESPGVLTLIVRTPAEALTPGAVNTFELSTPIRVFASDLLGLRTVSGSVNCLLATGDDGDVIGKVSSRNVTVGSSAFFNPFLGELVNVAAAVGPPSPASPDECRSVGWAVLSDNEGRPFKHQGDCARFSATRGGNPPRG